MKQTTTIILGAGMTGLAAGYISGLPVYEALDVPGGICSSYYVAPGSSKRLKQAGPENEVYRFEIGGGHWIFGGDAVINHFIQSFSPWKRYDRRSSVYFHQMNGLYVPYPLQNHLGYLGNEIARKALTEMSAGAGIEVKTMADWIYNSFGKTLADLFFAPFHELYTAKLWKEIAPQDSYKSPVNLALALHGAFEKTTPSVGYNTSFLYPLYGLDELANQLAGHCDITYGKRVAQIKPDKKEVLFEDGSGVFYKNMIATLPLNQMLSMSGLELDMPADPYSSVLVLNIGAKRGIKCPDDHWLYNPDAQSGFHRVGFYSNVDASFVPYSSRQKGDRVSIYVERAYPGGQKPSGAEVEKYVQAVARELQDWQYITEAEVIDPTWIDVAYTWSWPGSKWRSVAIQRLQQNEIYPSGRYAVWSFNGIAHSFREGLMIGAAFKKI